MLRASGVPYSIVRAYSLNNEADDAGEDYTVAILQVSMGQTHTHIHTHTHTHTQTHVCMCTLVSICRTSSVSSVYMLYISNTHTHAHTHSITHSSTHTHTHTHTHTWKHTH